jgi:hypothetical protein
VTDIDQGVRDILATVAAARAMPEVTGPDGRKAFGADGSFKVDRGLPEGDGSALRPVRPLGQALRIRIRRSLIAAFLTLFRRFLLNLLIDGAAFLIGAAGLLFRLVLLFVGVLIGFVLVRHDGLP